MVESINYLDLALEAAFDASKEIMKIYQREFRVEEKEDKTPLTEADLAAHNVIKSFLEKSPFPIMSEEGKSIEYSERKEWKTYWCVDPIDGTKEFIKRNGEFTVNIALIHEGVPVMGVIYAPAMSKLYFSDHSIGAFEIEMEDFESHDTLVSKASKLPHYTPDTFKVVGSRSHMSEETEAFVEELKKQYGEVEIISKGSSLKLCMVASGEAHIYPRYAPTMEWDTAAGQAIALGAGAKVINYDTNNALEYNKENLRNPWFTVLRD